MARTNSNQRSANRVAVDVGATGTRPASKGAVTILVVSVLAAIWAVAMMTTPGRVGYLYFFMYAEFYLGVITLVSLSITIMVGLVATDRLVLSIRQRVLLQSIHRTTGVIAVTSLVGHIWTKYAEKHIQLIDAFVPFLYPGNNKMYVAMGTLSGWIMMLVMWTGLARSRFIGRGAPWMWRSIHAISYLMWPIALLHGLSAGRPAKAWVTVSYVICVLLVLVGLAVRLSVSLNRRKDFSSTATGAIKPAGTLVPTASPIAKRPSRREQERADAEALGPVAVLDPFQPVAPPAPPGVAEPPRPYPAEEMPVPRPRRMPVDEGYESYEGYEDERPRGRRRADDEIEYDEPTPRGRRYSAEDTGTRMRRPDLEDTGTRLRRAELEDTGTRLRRAELEDTGTRLRRAEADDARAFHPDFDEAPPPRGRRYAAPADDDEPAPRPRRRAADHDYEDVPRPRTARYDDEPVRRSARPEPRYRDTPDTSRRDRAEEGRHSRSGFLDLADDDRLAPDETPTLIDMASRRARREQLEPVRVPAGRGTRRGGRSRGADDLADDDYWSRLRGEAN